MGLNGLLKRHWRIGLKIMAKNALNDIWMSGDMFVPKLGMFCSHVGNGLFPRLGIFAP